MKPRIQTAGDGGGNIGVFGKFHFFKLVHRAEKRLLSDDRAKGIFARSPFISLKETLSILWTDKKAQRGGNADGVRAFLGSAIPIDAE